MPFIFCNGQAFDLEKEWLGEEGFFRQEFIKRNAIREIQISKSVKKDLEYFQDEQPYLKFIYNKSGQLEKSHKFIQMSNGVDTAIIEYSYNSANQVYKKRERQGSFVFDYFYFFEDGKMNKELKINAASESRDTSYIRRYSYSDEENKIIQTVYNSNGSPFMYWSTELDNKGKTLQTRNYFQRNQNFTEYNYAYNQDKIAKKEVIEYFRERNVLSNLYTYNNSELESILMTYNENLIEKFSFTYDKFQFPTAIIQREVEEKSISIYRLSYLIEVD